MPYPGQNTRSSHNRQKKTRNCRIVDFAVLFGQKLKMKESEKRQVREHCQRTKKAAENKDDGNISWKFGMVPQILQNCALCCSSGPQSDTERK